MKEHLIFIINNQPYAISIEYLQEISHQVKVTPVPGLQSPFKGVINLRGRVVPVFSFSELLSVNSNDDADKFIVFNYNGNTFAAVVEKVNEVIRIEEEKLSDAEGVSSESPFIKGFYRLPDNSILHVIDTEKTINEISAHLKKQDNFDNTSELHTRNLSEITGKLNQLHQKEQTIQKILSGIEQYLEAIRSADVQGAEKALIFIKRAAEEEVIDEVKKLVENVHHTMNEFRNNLDTRLRMLADSALSGTSSDIEKVINQTEEATTKTISIIEKQLNAQSDMVKCLDEITEKTKEIEEQVNKPLQSLRQLIEALNMDLMEALVAQQFQDLTGQILKKTLSVIKQIEKGLEGLIHSFGLTNESAEKKQETEKVKGQGEVDELLAQYDL